MIETLKKYHYIKVFVENPGPPVSKASFSLHTSFAIKKLRDDFYMLSAGLRKQHDDKRVEFYVQFAEAHQVLIRKIEQANAVTSHLWEGIPNELVKISFEGVFVISPNCAQLIKALRKIDSYLVGAFSAKNLGLISRDEFKNAIAPYKAAWLEFITTILPKPTKVP